MKTNKTHSEKYSVDWMNGTSALPWMDIYDLH